MKARFQVKQLRIGEEFFLEDALCTVEYNEKELATLIQGYSKVMEAVLGIKVSE